MFSACGNYALIYNGEIYNSNELRSGLEKILLSRPNWRSSSDTETLLCCLIEYGIETTLPLLDGMFAFAFYDINKKTITLARDIFGEKPLYYGFHNDIFSVASDLNAFKPLPQWPPSLSYIALGHYFKHGYISDRECIYNGFSKVQPGTYLTYDCRTSTLNTPRTFWSTVSECTHHIENKLPSSFSDSYYADQLDSLVTKSVKSRLLSDVPVASFLSGGIDSSYITSVAQRVSDKPISTFTIGFSDSRYDESSYAREIASYLGTCHNEYIFDSSDLLDLLPTMPHAWDEPFSDSSQLPTYLVSRLASSSHKVCLSGDAGDELFLGYNRYNIAYSLYKTTSALPLPLRALVSCIVKCIPPESIDSFCSLIPLFSNIKAIGDRAHKFSSVLSASDFESLYITLTSLDASSNAIINREYIQQASANAISPIFELPNLDPRDVMALSDILHYLVGDILVKVDRAAMACSLETRIPFLSREVARFAWSLPLDQKIRAGKSKFILRNSLTRYLPPHLFDRPKMGFGVPLPSYLRKELKPWLTDILSPSSLSRFPYINSAHIQTLLRQHLSGTRNWSSSLWAVASVVVWSRSR
jgi:asparagine synthase (glutamine-hydrolysing)